MNDKKTIRKMKFNNLKRRFQFDFYLSYKELLQLKTIVNITKEFKQSFIQLIYENIKVLDPRCEDVPEDQIKRIIAAKIKGLNVLERDFFEFENDTLAYYRKENNSIFYRNDTIKKWDKRSIFHELIHCMGKNILNSTFNDYLSMQLIEGGTENIVETIYGGDDRENIMIIDGGMFKYPLSRACSYRFNVLLIRQMECAIGEKGYFSILNGDNDFFNKFSGKYGIELFRYLQCRTLLLANKGQDFNFFEKTQNVLLSNVFDQDFNELKNIEDAKKYFQKMLEFSEFRGVVNSSEFLFNYYEQKKQDVRNKLKDEFNISDKELKEYDSFIRNKIDRRIEHKKQMEKQELESAILASKIIPDVNNSNRNQDSNNSRKQSDDNLKKNISENQNINIKRRNLRNNTNNEERKITKETLKRTIKRAVTLAEEKIMLGSSFIKKKFIRLLRTADGLKYPRIQEYSKMASKLTEKYDDPKENDELEK